MNTHACVLVYVSITGFDVISLMQAECLLSSFDAKTMAFDIIFVLKTSKKTPIVEVILHPCIRGKYPEQVKIAENLVGYARKPNATSSLDVFEL